ncbi:hypothetical protein [Streptomyces sp. JH34]|uniref:hypothetical protein n=1 Tax=Streptomyces sp. JH34 TaxID=2793633 RepID=UPI0023F6876D|nr:hypothetical protein [Streptomyces sp. JH34]MDF6017261.1 hypothetical protein [Streptomyces sp. JH34]
MAATLAIGVLATVWPSPRGDDVGTDAWSIATAERRRRFSDTATADCATSVEAGGA